MTGTSSLRWNLRLLRLRQIRPLPRVLRPWFGMTACASLALLLAGCASSEVVTRTLPPKPDQTACFSARFPEIPDRDLTPKDVSRIIGGAKQLDARKTGCGLTLQVWADGVEARYAGK